MCKVLEARPRGQEGQLNAVEITLAAVTMTTGLPHMMSPGDRSIFLDLSD